MIARDRHIVSALFVGIGLLLGTGSTAGQSTVGLPLGTPAPSAELEDLEGNTVDLLDFVRRPHRVLGHMVREL